MKKLVLFLFITCHFLAAKAGGTFTFTPEIIAAYNDIMALRIDKGNKALALIKEKDPSQPAVALIEDYSYFLQLFIDEKKSAFTEGAADWEKRFSNLEAADKSSPYQRFACAEMLTHQGVLRFKYGDYQKGAYNIREAYLLLKENEKLFPSFLPNKKSIGMLEVLVGTIPKKYEWVSSILGMKGNIDGGMKKLQQFTDADIKDKAIAMLQKEGVFLMGFLQLHIIKDKEKAWALIDKKTKDYPNDLLKVYVRASIAMHCKKNDEAIATLQGRPRGKEYFPFYYLEYMLGNAKLYRQDKDADKHFLSFVSFFKGQNYIKDAYLKLAWHYHINGNTANYHKYLGMIAHFGSLNVDEDKQADKEALAAKPPLIEMIKGRLLFDGGYYTKALETFKSLPETKLITLKEKTEYSYRLARVYHENADTVLAIPLYNKTIQQGGNEPWYYAAASSLQLGYIYSARKEYITARYYLEGASKFPNTEYKNSIDQKAATALEKLKSG